MCVSWVVRPSAFILTLVVPRSLRQKYSNSSTLRIYTSFESNEMINPGNKIYIVKVNILWIICRVLCRLTLSTRCNGIRTFMFFTTFFASTFVIFKCSKFPFNITVANLSFDFNSNVLFLSSEDRGDVSLVWFHLNGTSHFFPWSLVIGSEKWFQTE